MTSKNLFFKLIWQDFKKRIWYPIIIFALYILCMEMQLFNRFNQMKRYPSNYGYSIVHYFANDFFSPDYNTVITVMTCMAAALCAFSGFAYMHSRKQLDLYHSLPVRREWLFFSRYVSGMLMYSIPFAIHVLLCLVIGMTNRVLSGHAIINAICFVATQIIVFLLAYTICIVAVCLTGNMIIGILGGCVLFSYSSIVELLIDCLCADFLHTYIIKYNEEMWAFSPLGMLIKMYKKADEYREVNIGFSYQSIRSYLIIMIVAVIIFTMVALFLYKKRATEAAGHPIAFKLAEPFIKAMVLIPLSIFGGFFIRDMVDANSFKWYVCGIVFSFFIIGFMTEAIFRLDIKCAFHHWKQLIFNGVCIILVVIVLKYDVLGYNTYIPEEQELSGCAVSIGNLLDVEIEEYIERRGYRYIDSMTYCMDHMNILDNPSALRLARKAAKENLHYTDYDYYEGIEVTPEYQEMQSKEENYRNIVFKYTKTNGKNIYRNYCIDISDAETMQLLADIFNDTDYKLGAFPLLADGWKREYDSLYCLSNDYEEEVKISSERQAKLLEVYRSELLKLTLDDVMHVIPLGNLSFQNESYYRNNGGYESGYKIYPQFIETIELLKEYGFDYTKRIPVQQIQSMTFEKIMDVEDEFTTEEIEYTDQDSIEAIYPLMVRDELCNGLYGYYDYSDTSSAFVCYEHGGLDYSNYYHILNEDLPDYIKKDLQIVEETE